MLITGVFTCSKRERLIPDSGHVVANLRHRCRRVIFSFALCLLTSTQLTALEFPEAQQAEAWLLTYGPGDLYWQRFGHNAIWIRDRDRSINHSFNFGYFDFDQPGFISRFVQGRMMYFGAAFNPALEMQVYTDAGRMVRAQRLQLTQQQVHSLENYLVNEVQPENRDYLYDYFYANCSTRLRDALDLALDGGLSAVLTGQAANLNIRQRVNRLSWPDPWLFLALQAALGSPIDNPATRWDEAFVPGQLAGMLAEFHLADGTPLVIETRYEGTQSNAPSPSHVQIWLRYLAWGAVAALVLLVPGLFASRRQAHGRSYMLPVLVWPVLAGIAGCFLLYLWLGTNHAAAAQNWTLLVLNPLLLPLSVWSLRNKASAGRTALALIMVAGWLAGTTAWLFLPGAQDNSAVLALSLPLAAYSSWMLAGKSHIASRQWA